MSVLTNLVAPLIGTIICNCMWFSPLPMVLKARLSRDLGDANPLPFVITIINCVGWLMYGCLKKDYFLFFSNITGIILGIYSSLTALSILAEKKETGSNQYMMLEGLLIFCFAFWSIIGMVASVGFSSSNDPLKEGEAMVGLLSSACSIAYFAAPLSVMAKVIMTRDASALYFPTILVNTLNALMWTVYGAFGVNDANIWVPNFIGLILSVCQLAVIIMFRKGTLWQMVKGEVPEPMSVKLDSMRSTSAIKMPHTTSDSFDDLEDNEEVIVSSSSAAKRNQAIEKQTLLASSGNRQPF